MLKDSAKCLRQQKTLQADGNILDLIYGKNANKRVCWLEVGTICPSWFHSYCNLPLQLMHFESTQLLQFSILMLQYRIRINLNWTPISKFLVLHTICKHPEISLLYHCKNVSHLKIDYYIVGRQPCASKNFQKPFT